MYQNILYETLTPKRRMLLHRRAGEELLLRFLDKTASVAAQLAMHFERCRDFSKAVMYVVQMGDNAGKVYDNAIAVGHYSIALEMVKRLTADEQKQITFSLRQRRGASHLGLGQLAEAEADFTAMLEHARSVGDPKMECVALNALANFHHYSRRVADLGIRATEAMRVAERIGNDALRSEAMGNVALVHQVSGDLEKAKTLFEGAIRLARCREHLPALLPALTYGGVRHFFQCEYDKAEAMELEAAALASKVQDGFHLANSLFYLGLIRTNQGRLCEALATLNQALEMARRNGNKLTLSRVPNGLGFVYRQLNDLEHGIEYDRLGVELSREAGRAEAEANSLINLVHGYIHVGAYDLALGALSDVEPLTEREEWIRWRFYGIRFQAAAAEFWQSQGNLERAHEHASQLLKNATRHGVPNYVAIARKLLGGIALASGEYDCAVKELRSAVDAIQEHSAPLVAWRVQAALGRALKQLGDREGMQNAFVRSESILTGIASTIIDNRVRESFLNSPEARDVLVHGVSEATKSTLHRHS
jgi:tetratricopeptide (TPR) repeat protein